MDVRSPRRSRPGPRHADPADRTLRAGILGLGVGEQHIAGYRAHPACEVAVLCDLDAGRRREVAGRHPTIPWADEPLEVLRDPSIDLVSIATYDAAHGGQVLEALRHGKHVFVEKPLCVTADEARAIRAALNDRPDLALSSNLILRRSPRFAALRERIAEGAFGRLFHVAGDYHYGRLEKLTHGWRGRDPGYSVTLGGAVHMVDLLMWLTGERIVEVAAIGNGIASRGSVFAGDDLVAALVRFESGLAGTVTANFGCVRPHGHGLVVHGTRATFENGHPYGRLFDDRDPSRPPRPVTEPHPGAAKGDLIASFVDSILDRAPPVVDADDVFRSLSVCLAIDHARRAGNPVAVEYIR